MRSEDLCKFGKEYLIPLTCKFYTFSRQNLENFDISNVILPLLIINFKKKQSCFGPHYSYLLSENKNAK